MTLSLCLSWRLGGGWGIISVAVFELPAALSCLPGATLQDITTHPHAGACCHMRTAPTELRDRISKRKREKKVLKKNQVKIRKRGSEIEFPRALVIFIVFVGFFLVVHVAKLLSMHVTIVRVCVQKVSVSLI